MITKKGYCGLCPAIVLCISMIGCNQPPVESGPSYAELVVTYNAQLAALDRLEAKQKILNKGYAAAAVSNTDSETLSKLEGLLKSATDFKDNSKLASTSDPNALLDDLSERNVEVQDITDQLIGSLLEDETAPNPEVVAERKGEIERELAKLDTEITKQRKRVERARQARDAAEAKSLE